MRILILCSALFIYYEVRAQQEPLSTMYWNNYAVFNPAYSGLDSKHYGAISGRQQWAGMDRAPLTLIALYDVKSGKIHGGAGVNYIYDRIGFITSHKANLNYSFQLPLKKSRYLSFGISAGTHSITMDKYRALEPNDPAIPNEGETETVFNLNAGMVYKTDRFDIGFSSTQVNQVLFKKHGGRNIRHYYLTSAYEIKVQDKFELKPGFILRSGLLSSTALDLNLLFLYDKRYWAGTAFRYRNAVIFMGGVDVNKKIRIAYAYDHIVSSLKKHSNGSHEITMGLLIPSE